MSNETQQPSIEPTQPEPISTPPVENPTPNQSSQSSDDTGQVSEPNPVPVSPQEPILDTPTPPTDSTSSEMPPEAPQTFPNPENAILVNNDIPANEPLESAPVPESASIPENPNPPATASPEASRTGITVEKHGDDVTITEVMEPKPEQKPETAQMAGNEPLDIVEEEKIKKRKENLKLANETRQEKKREKINEILNLFAEEKNGSTSSPQVTNDEVEKLLHVSDATATRYLETLEKEGKIKQVGKTGKHTHYEKI